MNEFLTIESVYCTTVYSKEAFKDLLHKNGLCCKNCSNRIPCFNEVEYLCGDNVVSEDHFCIEFERKIETNG